MTFISSNTLTTSATSVDFTSIPSTYTDLVLYINYFDTTGRTDINPYVRLNDDSGSNYTFRYVAGSGSAASSGAGSNIAFLLGLGPLGAPNSTDPASHILHISNYSNTTTHKSTIGRFNIPYVSTIDGTVLQVGRWASTSAINKITINAGATNGMAAGSVFMLYGIKAA